MAQQTEVTLSDGTQYPQIGFGTFKIANDDVGAAVKFALDAGYRHIDTAASYGNEAGVGDALRASGLPRSDYVVTSKIPTSGHGYDAALKAFDATEAKLNIGPIDLMLIHWPIPSLGLYVETWKALIELQKQGRIKSIGVSNFHAQHLERIIGETGVVPVVNQIELHPAFQQHEQQAVNAKHNIIIESWSPLGRGAVATDPVLMEIGRKYGKKAVQVVIRWHLDQGFIVLPKSVTPERIKSNFDVFDFKLDADDMAAIAKLDTADGRMGPDPETFAGPPS